MVNTPSKTDSTSLLDSIIEGIQDVKGLDVVVIDLRDLLNTAADYFVICHGSSSTHVQAIGRSIEHTTREHLDERPWHSEGINNATWLLQDYSDVVVHVFQQETREFYQLEDLWADAKIKMIENVA
jgi:ribosome-associated protein